MIERFKVGRATLRVNRDASLRHELVAGLTVSDLLGAVTDQAETAASA